MSLVKDVDDLIKRLDVIWCKDGGHGTPLLLEWKEGACFEVIQHDGADIGPITFERKKGQRWTIRKGTATPDMPADCRLHYYGRDVVVELEKAKSKEDLLNIYANLVKRKKITIDVYAKAEVLEAKGYIPFAKRVGFI